MERAAIARDIKENLGFFPDFLERIPDPHLASMWQGMRDLQLRAGVVPAKYQQLIMLAVATYAKCKYCTDLHTEVARAFGASDREIIEVALLTAQTASLGNYLGGTQYDLATFNKDVRAICQVLGGGNVRPRDPISNSSLPLPLPRARGH